MNWKNILLNTLALFLGLFIGGSLNMIIIQFGSNIIPNPDGYNGTTVESINAGMHLLQPKHFILPFVAHALGTFVGAFIAAFISPNYKLRFALGIGVFFLFGGIMMVFQIEKTPLLFALIDLVFAYIPMAYLGYLIAVKFRK